MYIFIISYGNNTDVVKMVRVRTIPQKLIFVAFYVDDLAFAVKDPQSFIQILREKYQFKIKEAGPLEFHLGADFFRDDKGILCMAP